MLSILKKYLTLYNKTLTGIITIIICLSNSSMKTRVVFFSVRNSLFLAILFPLLLFACKSSVPNRSESDSVVDSLVNLGDDSLEANPYFAREQWRKAIHFTVDSLSYYQIYSALISSYMRVGDYDSGCIMAKRLIQFCNKEVKSPLVNSLLCEGYNYLGVYNSEMRNIDSSIVCYKRAIEQACYSSKPSQIANLYINIADVYTQKSDYVSSVYYYRRALQVSDSLKIVDQLAFPIYFGLGQAYFGIAEYDLSDRYFRQAEKGLENRTLSEKFTFCNNRGNYYYYKGE